MCTAQNVSLARRWFEEVWNQRRVETIDELIHPEGVVYSVAGVLRGPEIFKSQVHAPFLAAFPDFQISVDRTVAEGDQVVVLWTMRGTHTGDGLGIIPTGHHVTQLGMTWIRYQDGKMKEGRDCWNLGGLLESLRSAVPGPADHPEEIV